MSRRNITFAEGILGILTYHGGGWRVVRGYINRETVPCREARKYTLSDRTVSDATVRTTLSRLKKLGYVRSHDGAWSITKAGGEYLNRLSRASHRLPAHNTIKDQQVNVKNTTIERIIVAFDIPESKRATRRWLRIELGLLGFELLQQSVWIGPTPLPEEFITDIKDMDILEHLKFFHVSKTDVV